MKVKRTNVSGVYVQVGAKFKYWSAKRLNGARFDHLGKYFWTLHVTDLDFDDAEAIAHGNQNHTVVGEVFTKGTDAQAYAEACEQDTTTTIGEVISALKGASTKTGGRLTNPDTYETSVCFDCSRRSRLDHYGNDGMGWDEEGWETNYAGPLAHEVETLLKDAGIKLDTVYVTIGEKGHVDIDIRG